MGVNIREQVRRHEAIECGCDGFVIVRRGELLFESVARLRRIAELHELRVESGQPMLRGNCAFAGVDDMHSTAFLQESIELRPPGAFVNESGVAPLGNFVLHA